MSKNILNTLIAVVLSFSLINCKGKEEKDSNPLEGLALLSGEFSSGGSQKLGGLNIAQYTFYCMTFTSPSTVAQSSIDSTGYFSLYLPQGVPFGCFINETATNSPVASIVIEGQGTGFQSSSNSVLALNSNLHLPALNLDLDEGKVVVPEASVAPVLAQIPAAFDIADVHNGAYQMSCISTGNAQIDTDCADFINDNNGANDQVYLRVMSAMDNATGDAVRGLGVWKDQSSFNACGGIDMLDSLKADIELDDNITFNAQGVVSGTQFVNNQVACPGRDGVTVIDHEDIENYYALGKLIEVAGTYTLHIEDERVESPNCVRHEITSVTFEGSSAQQMIGSFNQSKHYEELVLGACSGKTNEDRTFLIQFDKTN